VRIDILIVIQVIKNQASLLYCRLYTYIGNGITDDEMARFVDDGIPFDVK
jgi:hypothetical protein